MHIRLKVNILFLLLIGGCATTWPVPGTLSDGAESVVVPSAFWGDHVFVEASFDSSDARYRLLDTGFTFSIIDFKTAESLNMPATGESRLSGIGPEKSTGKVSSSPVKIQVIGIEPYAKTVPIADLSELSPVMGRSIDGVIGSDLFFRFIVEIDYATKTVKLFDKRTFNPDPESIAIPITIRRNRPYVEAALSVSDETEIKGEFMIDTGSNGSISINSRFTEEHKLLNTIPKLPSSQVAGIGGSINVYKGILNRFFMNTISLNDVPIT